MLDALAAHLDVIASHAPVWGFLLVFLFMAVESSFIPFPSEIVMIPAGFLAARGELTTGIPWLDLTIAILVGLFGSLAGAWFNYALSAHLGEPFLRRYGKWFFVKPEALDRANELFNRYGAGTTFVCRLLPVIRQLISIPAGIARMPLASFSFFTGLGAGIWSAVLAITGFWLAKTAGTEMSWAELVHKGKDITTANLPWIVLGALLATGLYWALSKLVMRKN